MSLVSRVIAAVLAAVRAVKWAWEVVWASGKSMLRLVAGAPEPLPPLPATVPVEPQAEDVAAGLRRWAAERMSGATPRLPRGVTPAAAEWAIRLIDKELTKVSRASPAAIRAHLDGSAALAGVRPTLRIAAASPDQAAEERVAARAEKKAEMRAAMARVAQADRRRRDAWIERDGVDPFGDAPALGRAL